MAQFSTEEIEVMRQVRKDYPATSQRSIAYIAKARIYARGHDRTFASVYGALRRLEKTVKDAVAAGLKRAADHQVAQPAGTTGY